MQADQAKVAEERVVNQAEQMARLVHRERFEALGAEIRDVQLKTSRFGPLENRQPVGRVVTYKQ